MFFNIINILNHTLYEIINTCLSCCYANGLMDEIYNLKIMLTLPKLNK